VLGPNGWALYEDQDEAIAMPAPRTPALA
jgi:hypothetical protein